MTHIRTDAELIETYWHFGCHSDELRQEGDYLLHRLGDRDVVLYHDGDEIIAFDNRCPHRGTKFFESTTGSARAVCKYHGWAFTAGRLIIPLEAELRQDCPRPTLNRYDTEWCGTLLFFAIAPKAKLIDQLGDNLYSLIEALSFDIRTRRDLNHYIYECPWQVGIENALEPEHLPFIHPETLNKLQLINCKNQYWGENSGVYFDIGNHGIKKNLERISRFYDLGPDVHSGYMSLYLFPFCFISSTAGTSYSIQCFFPRSAVETWFSARLYSVRLSDIRHESADEVLITAATDMNRRVFEEDHEICKRISLFAWQDSLKGTLYNSEEKIAAFRKQLRTLTCQK